jgi:hypothetical protein
MKRKFAGKFYSFKSFFAEIGIFTIEVFRKIDWKIFGVVLILIPVLLTLVFLMFLFEISNLSADFVTTRGDGVLPDREGYSADLPAGDLITDFIPAAIRIFLLLVSLATTASLVYSGFLFVTHFGDEAVLQKAKKILTWSIIGIAFVSFSYAIVWAVVNLNFTRM